MSPSDLCGLPVGSDIYTHLRVALSAQEEHVYINCHDEVAVNHFAQNHPSIPLARPLRSSAAFRKP